MKNLLLVSFKFVDYLAKCVLKIDNPYENAAEQVGANANSFICSISHATMAAMCTRKQTESNVAVYSQFRKRRIFE
jgi:hypothetical protein